MVAKKLQKEAIIIKKIIQIYEVKLTRHGNMLVGQSCSGKSTAWTILQVSVMVSTMIFGLGLDYQ